jgi:hypothetical protein
MPQVPSEFFPDFARGAFEGDGSYILNKTGLNLRIGIVSGSRDFIHDLAERLAFMGLTRRKPHERKGKKSHFELKYGLPRDCRLYYELAYKNTPASMCMDRKRKIIEEWYNLNFG